MSIYLIPIEAAILTFPILAAMITIPYIIVQYRKYGSIHPFRIVVVYSFIFYLLCAYFLVIMPLPPISEVANYTNPTMQLSLFDCFREFTLTTSFVWNNPSTYWTAFNEPSLFLIVFNIFLCLPFGIYLRYYFECSWKKTLWLSFLLTLSFECIQLSALFGIYPRPYRLFDVDDLFNNTLGAMIGYAITPLFSRFLPTRANIDTSSLLKGQQVSPLRRITALFVDLCIIMILSALSCSILLGTGLISLQSIPNNFLYHYFFFVFIVIMLLSLFTKGKTFGKKMVNIQLVKKDAQALRWYDQVLHYGILYLFIIPCPYIVFLLLVSYLDVSTADISYELLIMIILCILYIFSLIQSLRSIWRKDYYAWYDRYHEVHNISTIVSASDAYEKEEPQDSSTIQPNPSDQMDIS